MKITDADVLHAATLARIELDADETRMLRRDLDSVLGYMDMISGVKTDGVKPTHHPQPVVNAMREDEERGCQSLADAVRNAPGHRDGCIVVPKVIE